MRIPLLAAAALALLVLAAAPADAHAAGAPEPAFTRLLADANDDCGGDAGAATGACRGSHDLLAIDVQEKWSGDGEVLVVRFWLDKGKTFPITDTFTFSAPGGGKTLAIRTADDASFAAAAGFEAVSAPHATGDGTRFTIDGTIRLATLGLTVGDQVSGFKVESKAGGNVGDYMPGGCHTTLGDCAPLDTSTVYTKPSHTLQGTSTYARLEPPQGTVRVEAGQEQTVQLGLTNLLAAAQSITVRVRGGPGVEAGMHSGAMPGEGALPDSTTTDVPTKGSSTLHLRVRGLEAGSGTLTLTLDTDKGGHAETQVPYTVTSAGEAPSAEPTGPGEPSKGSPAPAATLLATLLLGLARRRS